MNGANPSVNECSHPVWHLMFIFPSSSGKETVNSRYLLGARENIGWQGKERRHLEKWGEMAAIGEANTLGNGWPICLQELLQEGTSCLILGESSIRTCI